MFQLCVGLIVDEVFLNVHTMYFDQRTNSVKLFFVQEYIYLCCYHQLANHFKITPFLSRLQIYYITRGFVELSAPLLHYFVLYLSL